MADKFEDLHAMKEAPAERQYEVPSQREAPQQSEETQQRRVRGQPVHDVFVSYSSNDKPVADAIVSRLEQAGIRCWVAPRDVLPGMVWGKAIVQAIETSRLMVVVLSAPANESQQVIREVERAVAHNVVVVPFRIESVEPTGALAYFLASEHWLDAMTPPLESHIAQLVHVAQSLLENGAAIQRTAQEPVTAPTVTDAVKRHRSRGLLVAAAVVATALAIFGIVAGILLLSPAEEPNGEETPSSAAQPTRVSLPQLAAGDCLRTPQKHQSDPLDFWQSEADWPLTMEIVSCDQSHGGEVFFVGEISAREPTPYPGDKPTLEKMWQRCDEAFEAYVGIPYSDSALDYTSWLPDAASWRRGDRQIGCVAYDPGGELDHSVKRSYK